MSRWLCARAIFPVSAFLKHVTWEKLQERLANHLKYFRETMNEEGHGVGKKLGFIAQDT